MIFIFTELLIKLEIEYYCHILLDTVHSVETTFKVLCDAFVNPARQQKYEKTGGVVDLSDRLRQRKLLVLLPAGYRSD